MSIFQEGLQKAFESLQSKSSINNEFADYIFKPDDGVRYTFRFLEEQEKFVRFRQHSWLPVRVHKNDGTIKEFRSTFFCEGMGCQLCKMKIMDKSGVETLLRPQDLMAIPIYIIEQKDGKRVKEVGKEYILPLPGGKNKSIWKQILDASELKGTLMAHSYVLQRTGKSMDTVWSIQSLEKEDFDYSNVNMIDTKSIVQNCGLWKIYQDSNLEIITSQEPSNSENDFSNSL
jgi:hypothetical protein